MQDEELFRHLYFEFGQGGRRAVEFLRTADGLVDQLEETNQPRLGETIAYCIREALQSIPDSYNRRERLEWGRVSREVVKAKEQYVRLRGKPGESEFDALNELLTRIDQIDEFHNQGTRHQDQLRGIYGQLTGQESPSIASSPIDNYLKVFADSTEGLHSEISAAEARRLFQRAMSACRQLFLPIPLRKIEFGRLAKLDDISKSDVEELQSLVSSLIHQTHFFEQIPTPDWLVALLDSDLVAPDPGTGFWPARVAVRRLRDSHPDQIVAWMTELYSKQRQTSGAVLPIVAEAAEFGEQAIALVLQGLCDNPVDYSFIHYSLVALSQIPADTQRVEEFADILLNQGSWPKNGQAKLVMEKLVDGVNQENVQKRLKMICHKLRKIDERQMGRSWFTLERDISIADWESDSEDQFGLLLQGLTQIISGELDHRSPDDLLEQFALLPNQLRERLTSWVLAESKTVSLHRIVSEVARGIEGREPNGDDGLLIQRVMSSISDLDDLTMWSGSLRTLAHGFDHLDRDQGIKIERRIAAWSRLLPGWVSEAAGLDISSKTTDGYLHKQASYRTKDEMRFGIGTSPYSFDEIDKREPIEAAQVIGDWRQDTNSFLVSPLELARTLAEVVKADPNRWSTNPIAIVRGLEFPIYIQHYLSGLTSAIRDGWECSFTELWNLLNLLTHDPWNPPVSEFHDRWLSDDWTEVEVECVDLIKAFADNGREFDGLDECVWEILAEAVRDRSEASSIVSGGRDPLDHAINRPCTRALEAVLSFMTQQFRKKGEVPSECLELLEEVLQVEDFDGAQYRSILATRLGFLDYVAPDWLLKNSNLFMGDSAPDGLALVTCQMALKWGTPSRWLFRHHLSLLQELVGAGAERAVEHLVIAMLWEVEGCSATQICNFLRDHPESMSSAGESLGRLLRQSTNDKRVLEIAIDFWDCALQQGNSNGLYGFGWMSEIDDFDADRWIELIRSTLEKTNGRIAWGHGVLEKVMVLTPAVAHCEIANYLVRGTANDWDRFAIGRLAVDILSRCEKFAGERPYEQLRTALLERGIID